MYMISSIIGATIRPPVGPTIPYIPTSACAPIVICTLPQTNNHIYPNYDMHPIAKELAANLIFPVSLPNQQNKLPFLLVLYSTLLFYLR